MKWNKKSKSSLPILRIFIHSPRANDTAEQLNEDLVNCSQMSLGIHLSPETTDISSATWPKMKRSEASSGNIDVARIVRPQTATLERPRILDVTLLGKIDMTLMRKGLLSISSLCMAPLDNVQISTDAKRNFNSKSENFQRGKFRKCSTPRMSVDDKDRINKGRAQYRQKGHKMAASWDDEDKSLSESSSSVRKVSKALLVSRSPSRGTRDKGVSPVNSVSSNANSPIRKVVKAPEKTKRLSPVICSSNSNSPSRGPVKPAPREKRVSPVSSINNTTNSPSRASVVKNVAREKRVSPVGNTNSVSNNVGGDAAEKPSRRTCRRPVVVKKDGKIVDEVFGGPKLSDEVPEPCRTCGRPEQPERFHSHPPASSHQQRRQQDSNNNDDVTRPAVTKSSVRKPVPIKYRSGKSSRRKLEVAKTETETPVTNKVPSPDPLRRKTSVEVDTKGVEMKRMDRKSPRSSGGGVFLVLDDRGSDKPIARSGPRTVLCYLCGREFGTASFPLHEPHCLQRWERENAKLPPHLKRSAPEKPSSPLTVEQWNAFAWETSQAHLVPCANCGRTFNPDRLEVHQRSCRPRAGQVARSAYQQEQQDAGSSGSSSSSAAVKVPPAVYCYICGKMFGTRSIGIHEPQCLDKWRMENEKLPAHQRRSEPTKPQSRLATSRTVLRHPEGAPHVMDCYLCGREFDTRILNNHEDECIKHWRKWNSGLPLDQRQPEPSRPEFRFNKATGDMDYNATMEAIWQEHLQSLVPCSLGCGRTFNPDRVAVHERGCKGPKK